MAYAAGQDVRWPLATLAILIGLIFVSVKRSDADQVNDQQAWYQRWSYSLWLGSNSPLLDLSRSSEWLSDLSLSGYAQTTSAMWANSAALTGFGRAAGEHHGANSLAVERNLLQLDANYLLSGNNSWFLRFWGVYEPPYPWEAQNIAGPDLVYDKSQSSFYNRY